MYISNKKKEKIAKYKNNKEKLLKKSLIFGIIFTVLILSAISIFSENTKSEGSWSDDFSDDSKIESYENVTFDGYCELQSSPIENPGFENDLEDWMDFQYSEDGTGTYMSEIINSPLPPNGGSNALHLIVKEANEFQVLGYFQEIDSKYKNDLKSITADIYPISGECFGNEWAISIDVTAYDEMDEILADCCIILKSNGITPEEYDNELDLEFDKYTHINENLYDNLTKELNDNFDDWMDVSYISIDLIVYQGSGSKAGAYFDNINIGNYDESEYLTLGELTSEVIELPENFLWDSLKIDKIEKFNHNIQISIIDEVTSKTIYKFQDLSDSELDISTINPIKYNKIKLVGMLSGDGSDTPILNSWTVYWSEQSPWIDEFINQDKIIQSNNILVYDENIELIHWVKRKPITISNSGIPLSDYQVKVEVNYDSDMNGDFSDLRFTDSDEKTFLYYWIEDYNTFSDATVWVKVPSIPTGDRSIYMYYSNPFVSTASDPENTLELYDNFNDNSLDTNKWDTSEYYESHSSCSYAEQNNRMEFSTPKNEWNRLLTKKSFDDFALTVEVNHWSSASFNYVRSGIWGRIVDKNDPRGKNRQEVVPEPERRDHRLTNDVSNTVEQTISGNLKTWYKHEMILFGTTIKSKFRDYDYLTNTLSNVSSGRIGIGVDEDGKVYFDDIWVRKYVSPEPTTSIKSEQNTYYSALTNGLIISEKIELPKNCVLPKVKLSKTEPIDTSIKITILDGETSNPISGFEDLTESEIDISSIDIEEHPTLKLKADFIGTETSSPSLHNWSVEWKTIPYAYLILEPIIGNINDDFEFDASESWSLENPFLEYKYDFGDYESDWTTESILNHKYSEKTTFNGKIKVKTIDEIESDWSNEITVQIININPIADLTLSSQTPLTNENVTFNASNSVDEDGEIISYYFDFGDGTISDWITKDEITHKYLDNDEYQIRLRVKDDDGDISEWEEITITVQNRKPIVLLNINPKEPTINDNIEFDATGSFDEDGEIISYIFDFGDGNILESTNKLSQHLYTTKKIYNLKVRVIDDDNLKSDWYETDIEIKNILPNAYLEISHTITYINYEIIFNCTKSSDEDGNIVKYKYDFGDGNISDWITNSSINYNYSKPGLYFLKVMVMDNDNSESSWSEVVEVLTKNRVPDAVIDKPKNNLEFIYDEEIAFDASSSQDDDGDEIHFKWVSNIDGILYDGENTSFNKKLTKGTHNITLNVSDIHGAYNIDYITLIVKEKNVTTENGDNGANVNDKSSFNLIYLGLIIGIFAVIIIGVVFKIRSTDSPPPNIQQPFQNQQAINQQQIQPNTQVSQQAWQSPEMTQTSTPTATLDTSENITISCPVCGNIMNVVPGQVNIKCSNCGAEGDIGE